ncbi:MAG: hypothetical protein HGA19_11390, partial [Oscillochloris sp.]|nr:hypothetical protein [Oscillochloris sp.]
MLLKSPSCWKIAPILIVALLAALIELTGYVQAAPLEPAATDPNFWVTDGPVYSTALNADGSTIYLGGQFNYVGPQTGSLVALNNTTGATKSFPQINGEVKAIASDGNGGWFIGGNFLSVVDTQGANQGAVQTRNRLAHILSNNTIDPNWAPLANGTVLALAVSGSTVYVGGGFCYIGSEPAPRKHVAALSTSTGAAQDWNPGAGGAGACGTDNTTVNALAVGEDTIYIGGTFTTVGTQTRNNLAEVSTTDNASVLSWNPNPDNSVYALLLSGTTLYAGGTFMNVGTSPVVSDTILAAFDTTTANLAAGWSNPRISYSIGASPSIFVQSLVLSGNTLYFAGIFDNVGVNAPQPHSFIPPVVNEPTFRDDIAAVNATDGTLLPWYIAPYSDTSAAIYALALSPDAQTLYVGGNFDWLGGYSTSPGPGVIRSRLAALSTYDPANPSASSGQIVKATWNPSTNGPVEALAVNSSTIYAGGMFNSVGGVLRKNLAALSTSTGAALSTWNPSADDTVYALATNGATLYAGGAFTHIGSTVRNNLAAINSSGTLLSWDPNLNNTGGTETSAVHALAISETTIYAGGTFTSVGSTVRNSLAAIDSSGDLLNWDPNLSNTGGTGDPAVRTLVVNETTIYAGGTFTSIGGTTRNNLAALSTGGSLLSWNPNPDGTVKTLALSADGQTIYAGGAFTHMGGSSGTARNYLAALSANPTNSATVLSWNPNISNT